MAKRSGCMYLISGNILGWTLAFNFYLIRSLLLKFVFSKKDWGFGKLECWDIGMLVKVTFWVFYLHQLRWWVPLGFGMCYPWYQWLSNDELPFALLWKMSKSRSNNFWNIVILARWIFLWKIWSINKNYKMNFLPLFVGI